MKKIGNLLQYGYEFMEHKVVDTKTGEEFEA